MRNSIVLPFMAGMVAAVFMALNATAHDVNPPDWRGSPASTVQEWLFSSDMTPTPPDLVNNPYGMPSATVSIGPGGLGWFDDDLGLGSQTGYWDLGSEGQIALLIPNQPLSPINSYKLLRVQVSYYEGPTTAPIVSVPGATLMDSGATLIESDVIGSWWSGWTDWRFEPNPYEESVLVTGDPDFGSVIDQIVVDTICVVPEASSLAFSGALGVAALWVVRRRR